MTTANWTKILKQLNNNPVKLKKFMKHSTPKKRTCGRARHKCVRCGTTHGFVSRFGLNLCRRCFRQIATKIGFKQYS